jgi:hypothetical protein
LWGSQVPAASVSAVAHGGEESGTLQPLATKWEKADESGLVGVVGAHFLTDICHHVGRGTVVQKGTPEDGFRRAHRSTYQDLDCASTAVCRPVQALDASVESFDY